MKFVNDADMAKAIAEKMKARKTEGEKPNDTETTKEAEQDGRD